MGVSEKFEKLAALDVEMSMSFCSEDR